MIKMMIGRNNRVVHMTAIMIKEITIATKFATVIMINVEILF